MLGLKPIQPCLARERVAAAIKESDYIKTDFRGRGIDP